MENKFKSSIWSEFWEKQDFSEDFEPIDMVVKEAVGKLPFNKMTGSDKMKIKFIDINFCEGTKIKLNTMTNARPIPPIKDLSVFSNLINVEIIQVTYENLSKSMSSAEKFVLEDDVQRTSLFQHFFKLKKIVLIESCHDGERKMEQIR